MDWLEWSANGRGKWNDDTMVWDVWIQGQGDMGLHNDSSTKMSNSPLHITLKQMDKNEPIRRLKHIFASSMPTTLGNGQTSFPPLSFTITLFHRAPLKSHHSPCYTDTNPEHIHLWERPSSQPWGTTWQPWKKPKKKPWQHMEWPARSWGNETLRTFPLGKSKTRCGWKQ